jgi:hypothetical protein
MSEELKNQFARFLLDTQDMPVARRWLLDGDLKIYLRKEHPGRLTIAQTSFTTKREQEFRDFVDFIHANNPQEVTFWESITDKATLDWCLANGWEEAPHDKFKQFGSLCKRKRQIYKQTMDNGITFTAEVPIPPPTPGKVDLSQWPWNHTVSEVKRGVRSA